MRRRSRRALDAPRRHLVCLVLHKGCESPERHGMLAYMHILCNLWVLLLALMAHRGVKRPAEGGDAEDRRLRCPFKGYRFYTATVKGLAIHVSKAQHSIERSSGSSSEGSDASMAPPREYSSNSSEDVSPCDSDPVFDESCSSAGAAAPCSLDEPACHVSQSSHILGNCHSEADGAADGMSIPLEHNVVCGPEPSHRDSPSSSSSSSSNTQVVVIFPHQAAPRMKLAQQPQQMPAK